MGRQRRGDWGRRARALVLCVSVTAVTACTPLYDDHGYVPSDDMLAEIVVGVDTRETVAEVAGTPSSTGVLRDSGYFYVSQRMRTFAYQAPEIIDRQIVAISFDNDGVVANIERFSLSDGKVVVLSRRVTDSNVSGMGFLRQLVGNVGALDIGSNL